MDFLDECKEKELVPVFHRITMKNSDYFHNTYYMKLYQSLKQIGTHDNHKALFIKTKVSSVERNSSYFDKHMLKNKFPVRYNEEDGMYYFLTHDIMKYDIEQIQYTNINDFLKFYFDFQSLKTGTQSTSHKKKYKKPKKKEETNCTKKNLLYSEKIKKIYLTGDFYAHLEYYNHKWMESMYKDSFSKFTNLEKVTI